MRNDSPAFIGSAMITVGRTAAWLTPLVGLMEPKVEEHVLAFIDHLASRFGLVGVAEVPWPHVSFVVADGWDLAAVRAVAAELAAGDPALTVRAEPWSLFAGDSPMHPAIVRSVVRTAELAALQAGLVCACEGIVQELSPFVATGLWNPHITVATRDLTPALAGAVMAWLADTNPPPWSGRLDRLGLIEDRGDHHALVATVPLAGSSRLLEGHRVDRRAGAAHLGTLHHRITAGSCLK